MYCFDPDSRCVDMRHRAIGAERWWSGYVGSCISPEQQSPGTYKHRDNGAGSSMEYPVKYRANERQWFVWQGHFWKPGSKVEENENGAVAVWIKLLGRPGGEKLSDQKIGTVMGPVVFTTCFFLQSPINLFLRLISGCQNFHANSVNFFLDFSRPSGSSLIEPID